MPGNLFCSRMRAAVYRKEHFNAAHRLFNPAWTDEQNQRIYGKCNNPNFHGHNYEVLIRITGEVDPETGYVIDMKVLSDLVREHVIKRFDHRNLNLDVPEFSNLIPTAEHIAYIIWKILREKIDGRYELKIILYETERNFVEYPVD